MEESSGPAASTLAIAGIEHLKLVAKNGSCIFCGMVQCHMTQVPGGDVAGAQLTEFAKTKAGDPNLLFKAEDVGRALWEMCEAEGCCFSPGGGFACNWQTCNRRNSESCQLSREFGTHLRQTERKAQSEKASERALTRKKVRVSASSPMGGTSPTPAVANTPMPCRVDKFVGQRCCYPGYGVELTAADGPFNFHVSFGNPASAAGFTMSLQGLLRRRGIYVNANIRTGLGEANAYTGTVPGAGVAASVLCGGHSRDLKNYRRNNGGGTVLP
jgi:hypothetical protein